MNSPNERGYGDNGDLPTLIDHVKLTKWCMVAEAVVVTFLIIFVLICLHWVMDDNPTNVARHTKSLTIRVDAIENALNGAGIDACHVAQNAWQRERFQCYGIHHGNSDACSGHGKCVKPDSCICDKCYVGSQCERDIFTGSCPQTGIEAAACIIQQNICMKRWGRF